MKNIQSLYCANSFLMEVWDKRKKSRPHRIAYKILNRCKTLYIDLSKSELIKKIKDKENYPMYSILAGKDFEFKSIEDWRNLFDLENISSEVLFIDSKDIPKPQEVREQKGVLIVSNDDNDIHILTKLNDRQGVISLVPSSTDLKKNTSDKIDRMNQNSWNEALSTYPMSPTNAIIITDNYLGKNLGHSWERGLLEIIRYFKSSIVKFLNVPLDIAIFTHVEPNTFNNENQIFEIINKIKNIFDYSSDVRVTIIGHTEKVTTHEREILTNYHRLYCDRGFGTLNDDDTDSLPSRGTIQSVFHSIESTVDIFPITKHLHFQTIEWLSDICLGRRGMEPTYTFIIGDIKHRLLKFNNMIRILNIIKEKLVKGDQNKEYKIPINLKEAWITCVLGHFPHNDERGVFGMEGILSGKGTEENPFTFDVYISTWVKGDSGDYTEESKNEDLDYLKKLFPDLNFEYSHKARFKGKLKNYNWTIDQEEETINQIVFDWLKWQGEIEEAVKKQPESQTDDCEEDK